MQIHLPQLNKILDVEQGTNLFKALKSAGIPIASSCGGDGVCGKCIVSLEQGTLSEPLPLEKKLIEKHNLNPQERISCQCTLQSPLTLKTTYW